MKIDRVRELIDYDPATGEFRWRLREVRSKYDRIWNTQNAGQIAGCLAHHGYRSITIYGKRFYAHRLAYFYMTGVLPKSIDHRDGDTTNNRFDNLRPATQAQNIANSNPTRKNNKGHKGVSFHKGTGKWQAALSLGDNRVWLGLHETLEDAVGAYNRAAFEHFGEFARPTILPVPY